eukprot:Blabericola_migrator_1__1570@NODE_1415_length_4592_cov_302_060773_g942_i0_p2_GENE_NODE_1415_length_4592_cov_302_060773_g942_i0NODE_1415_length_4592_cov_302_060773_g942_i0_p2_ORF_typecomplete_len623_score154_78GHMP_kinases_C/PF08544_13/1_4e17GHMP_kinases_C/PF08544_13/8_1e03GalKase_gal_bdg/PF10509_9/3_5e16GHMP_kinases_N/PF00288_26/3_8e13_NODE_1415_length_4592_cov_302_060773_g942_i0741942
MQFIRKISNMIQSIGQGDSAPQLSVDDTNDGRALWTQARFSEPYPAYHVIAPGRVNLIGEHIDHQNYNVLPCAVEKSAHIFLSIEEKTDSNNVLEIRHVNSKKYTSKKFEKLNDIKVSTEHHWTNYVVASYLGMTEYYVVDKDSSKVGTHPKLLEEASNDTLKSKLPHDHLAFKSVRMLVLGNLPQAAGLSSSSALVVCVAMCFNAHESSPLDPKTVAAVCANSERYVGTAGGGMDQAAICLCRRDEAQWIGFNPLTTEPVKLPSELKIVVANTCRLAPKVIGAGKMYNKRVFELKTACFSLVKQFAPEEAEKMDGQTCLNLTLRDVLRKYVKIDESQMLQKLEQLIPNKVYSKADVDDILGQERRQQLLTLRCGLPVWSQNDDFYLHNRIKHVLTENARVTDFVQTCRQLEKSSGTERETGLKHLGELLNGSGKSLNEDFDASCEEIEELCGIARQAGAVGSRLTGAGWGGCTVSLVPTDKVEEFITTVREQYYIPYINGKKRKSTPLEVLPKNVNRLDEVIFATTPGPAARVVKISAPTQGSTRGSQGSMSGVSKHSDTGSLKQSGTGMSKHSDSGVSKRTDTGVETQVSVQDTAAAAAVEAAGSAAPSPVVANLEQGKI